MQILKYRQDFIDTTWVHKHREINVSTVYSSLKCLSMIFLQQTGNMNHINVISSDIKHR